MTKQTQSPVLNESLSALMDDEASELELQRLLKALDADPEVQATWSRYQIISAGIRGKLPELAPRDFAARVSAAIDDEEAHSPAGKAPVESTVARDNVVTVTPWWQQVGRVAIAASVAGAVIVGVQQHQMDAVQGSEIAASKPAIAPAEPLDTKAPSLPAGINAPALSARTVAVQSGYESRPQESRRVMFVPRQEAAPVYNEDISTYVNQLIQEHTDNASINAGQGLLPYTRVILSEEE